MLIRVRYTTGTYDYVTQSLLDDLIRSDRITQFLRSNGWARIGTDPIRTDNNIASAYAGSERRGEQRVVSLGLGLAKNFLRKGLLAVLICFTLVASMLLGTTLSAMFCPPAEIEDPYSAEEINAYSGDVAR
jgi:hypothetical protein